MFLGGIGWNGIMLAQNNIILGFADGSGRSRYIAAHGLLVSLGGLSGGLIGAGVVHVFGWMKESPIRLGALEWDNWHMTFFLALAARMTAVILALTMPDPGSMRIRAMARVMAGSIYNNVSSRLFFVVRIFGWGRRNDPGDK